MWFLSGLVGYIIKSLLGETFVIILVSYIIGYILFVVIAAEIYARMSYNRWLYEFTHESLRIERGIIWKKYSNIPFERVQNVDIHRGILARLLGFSSILIQTAGYSFSYGYRMRPGSEGFMPAVSISRAEEIRDFLMKKIGKRHSHSGGV